MIELYQASRMQQPQPILILIWIQQQLIQLISKQMLKDERYQWFTIHRRQYERDQQLREEWKNAVRDFYLHQVWTKLRQVESTQNQLTSIVQLAIKSGFSLKVLQLNHYESQIKCLQQRYDQIGKYYKAKLKECSSIKQIISRKQCSLQKINISYPSKIGKYCSSSYSLNALELFKIIDKNKMLSEVIVRGTEIEWFQQFIETFNSKQAVQQNDQLKWLLEFSPPKFLKLGLDARLQFKIEERERSFLKANNLKFFLDQFQEVSFMKIAVYFDKWESIKEWKYIVLSIWAVIQKIKKKHIGLVGQGYFAEQSISDVRSVIGALSTLRNISQFYISKFKIIAFRIKKNINDIFAMQESLATLIQNNLITHFKIEQSTNFFMIPQICNLQSIVLDTMSFRRPNNLFSSIVSTSRSLKSIEYSFVDQPCIIDEQTLNRLQKLNIYFCYHTAFNNNLSQSPSNIKSLKIQYSTYFTGQSMGLLFPKLINIVYLDLCGIDFGHEILCTIPSPHLEELLLQYNSIITNIGLLAVDSKWPQIQYLKLRDCQNLTEQLWGVCKFKGLLQLYVSPSILGQQKKALVKYRSKGIKVHQYS